VEFSWDSLVGTQVVLCYRVAHVGELCHDCGEAAAAAAGGGINLHQPAGHLKLGIFQNKRHKN